MGDVKPNSRTHSIVVQVLRMTEFGKVMHVVLVACFYGISHAPSQEVMPQHPQFLGPLLLSIQFDLE